MCGIGLVENSQEFHVLSQPEQIEKGLSLPGTKVIMKMGKNLGKVKEWLYDSGQQVWMVENCGMEGERVYVSPEDINEKAGYYSLLVVKEAAGKDEA